MLEKRLRNRSAAEHVTSEEVIARRLQEAREELKRLDAYKYALVNDVLDDAVAELRAIVLWARLGMKQEDAAAIREMAASCETRASSPRLRAVLASFGVTKDSTKLSTGAACAHLARRAILGSNRTTLNFHCSTRPAQRRRTDITYFFRRQG